MPQFCHGVRPMHCGALTRPRGAFAILFVLTLSQPAAAQTAAAPPKEPPPLWDAQVGASFVGTSGNTDTSSLGADFSAHRRGLVWQIESTANAVRASTEGLKTAERYLGQVQAKRKLTPIIGLTAGEKAERDRFSGIDFRNIVNGGLSWVLAHSDAWTLDGLTATGWNHESPVDGPARNDWIGVLQLLSRIPFGSSGDTTQRFTYYPDFTQSS